MKNSHTLVSSMMIFALLSLPVSSPATADLVYAGVSFTATDQGFADGKSRMMGWQFTVGNNPIVVQALGYQDFGLDGLAESHQVGIWRLSDQVLIDSVFVPSGTSGTLHGFFRYAPLDSPATLNSGTTYVISGFGTGIDRSVWDAEIDAYPNMDVSGFSVNSALTIGAAGSAHGPFQASFGFPTTLGVPDERTALMGPNLRFSAVPEPSAFALMSFALAGMFGYRSRRRQRNPAA